MTGDDWNLGVEEQLVLAVMSVYTGAKKQLLEQFVVILAILR